MDQFDLSFLFIELGQIHKQIPKTCWVFLSGTQLCYFPIESLNHS